ncbi:hypothetical protein DM558_07485 [Entomomonas moraniae]|uniref:Uncharacterized protein n=1 Tax=Entomomonas moraniae TaxID=2213226 RepID=A0A3Q9JJ15_9GAMM|nr:hypothetical protein [Entomomonas moraniae]AZS50630.1 hypothetical protein DM558_07485 [Entomomonas moraniae]
MKNITFFILDKYNNTEKYEHIEGPIFENKDVGSCHLAMKFEREDNETFRAQYPLEDILDEFTIQVEDTLDELNDACDNSKIEYLELSGSLDEIRNAYFQLNGKRAFNEKFRDDDGKYYFRLVIE